MIVERIWAANELRNYHYLVACAVSGEALAIDPLDWRACLQRAKARNWTITQIVNTHEHTDHTAGNAGLVQATGAKVLAHARAAARIGGVDRGLVAGDVIRVGRTVELESLDTPGHTLSHVCLLAHAEGPALFSGDTLFNAGVGNCRNGGDPERLYETCAQQLSHLPNSTRIFPGHDYLLNNLRFTRHVEAGNQAAADWLNSSQNVRPEDQPVLTLAQELSFNAFFRLSEPGLIETLRERVATLPRQPSPREVFLALRELRNSW
ncbi:MAG TPA: hydroxyacylglutathione hydrolase [Steroidobacteraceae bacterium]|nr:hydroxyacylglutathione hydrolase [Steroidobacteraceae bacterium]